MPVNFVRYGNFKNLNGRGMRSTKPIHPIFERNLSFIILNHPAKFHQNRSRTVWDNRYKNLQTDRHTHTQTPYFQLYYLRRWQAVMASWITCKFGFKAFYCTVEAKHKQNFRFDKSKRYITLANKIQTKYPFILFTVEDKPYLWKL